jgi:hypothetical protein
MLGNARAWWLWMILGTLACLPPRDGPHLTTHPLPPEDGYRVILYDVHLVEDDSDCHAHTPIKESDETLLVEWVTHRDVTMYARGGLYQTDVTLDDRGEYTYDGTGGVCLWGSNVWGRLDKDRGEGRLVCKKVNCTVVIRTVAVRHVDPDGGVAPDAG